MGKAGNTLPTNRHVSQHPKQTPEWTRHACPLRDSGTNVTAPSPGSLLQTITLTVTTSFFSAEDEGIAQWLREPATLAGTTVQLST